ncbi:1-acyl-sn-glycerol-3-phosphate acyltransferase [Acidiferrimicrobium sp. IK]|uniref:1-acyl-sn-glycerol-3-phosphate acyltransferase n=1 Tax=Acidiferrimicrobium sp. IK TaxID=2871700 RepID=UPI0021CAE4B1|nr:1-acyl-sn-glycerol-3-phosphate acyltransferase [Acidiferrimicrobium sp. IK]MCU4184071.1 1-acyl-sn-glycerol-3-phosphate acyltransferase [Acidiferrimicrobium sp. IK]
MIAIELALLVVFAAGAVVGLLLAPFGRRRRPLRVCAFGAGYLCVDLAAVMAAFGLWMRHPGAARRRPPPEAWILAHQRLLGWALGSILAWARRCAGFRVEIEVSAAFAGADHAPGAADTGALDTDKPVLVLARHGGPGDSFALVHMLLERYRRGVRIVLKDVLQADPALDIVLNRLGCCFLPSSRDANDDLAGRLAGLAGELHGRDTLLVFPEGGNWTPRRRRRAIRRLRSDGKADAANAAALMPHVLPPRPAGVLAVMEAQPGLSVVLVAHSGLDTIVTAGEAWRALPLNAAMTVRAWPAAPFPLDDEAAQLAWLTTEWAVIDQWVDRHKTRPA